MSELLLSLASATLSLGALAAILLALSPLLNRRFSARWRCWAWLVLALRLALPFQLSAPWAVVSVPVPEISAAMEPPRAPAAPAVPAPGAAAAGHIPLPVPPDKPPAGRTGVPGPDPAFLLSALWLGGAALFLGAHWRSYTRLRRTVRRWGRPAGAEEYAALDAAGEQAGVTARVALTVCPAVSSPTLAGWLRPVILLPEGWTGERLSLALLHELTHLKRGDLWYKALLVWCNALHWFNPVIWLLRARAERDVELACDEQALRGRDGAFRRSYGMAILEAATAQTPAALTSRFSGNGARLKARVQALLDASPRHAGRTALAAVICAALMGGSLVACVVEEPAVETYYGFLQTSAVLAEADPDPESVTFQPVEVDAATLEGGGPVTVLSQPGESRTLPLAAEVALFSSGGAEWSNDKPTRLKSFYQWPYLSAWYYNLLEVQAAGGEVVSMRWYPAHMADPPPGERPGFSFGREGEKPMTWTEEELLDMARNAADLRAELRSLDDITDEMLLRWDPVGGEFYNLEEGFLEDGSWRRMTKELRGEFTASGRSFPENGYYHKAGLFTGIDRHLNIHTDRLMDVELTYVVDAPEEALRAVILTAQGTLLRLEHSREEKTVTVTLPAGDNLVALAGYESEGEFRVQAPPQEGVTFSYWEDYRDLVVAAMEREKEGR